MQQVLIFLGIIGIKIIFSALAETVKDDAGYRIEVKLDEFNDHALNSAKNFYNIHHDKISQEQKQRFEEILKSLQ
ncbi:Uncharacterized protein dnl_11530 [Desulfonema limicola]|uniref:Uncharacterized protein n=1 Tax=Desulfonema limicola TaxID=45656 RepID=A0A975B509_9BACT|nr:hypothetical protein [Desulfonema limicola]QTA78906.1 Uncharacterized protein dnl_11530 [Desulfonema limicola]